MLFRSLMFRSLAYSSSRSYCVCSGVFYKALTTVYFHSVIPWFPPLAQYCLLFCFSVVIVPLSWGRFVVLLICKSVGQLVSWSVSQLFLCATLFCYFLVLILRLVTLLLLLYILLSSRAPEFQFRGLSSSLSGMP